MYIGLCNEGNVIQKLLFFFAKNTTCVSCSLLFIEVWSLTCDLMPLVSTVITQSHIIPPSVSVPPLVVIMAIPASVTGPCLI
jgi:hypothetical protein